MKRVGHLWPELTSFKNLLAAAVAAAAGKRSRPDVAVFLLDLEPNLLSLHRQLLDGSYRPGRYRTFVITEPKPRHISAAPFRDRVVHHALTRVLEPVFESRFSPFSFACRKGFGVHRALKVARDACRDFPYVLKCDIRKYFASIDHLVLLSKLSRVIRCQPSLSLAAAIVSASNPQEEQIRYFPGATLFTPFERRRGLPLGNQTSQFFANVYLDSLDQMVTRVLRPGAYARYVDDFVVFAHNKSDLAEMRQAFIDHLSADRLVLHPRKSRVYKTSEGLSFLGWRIFPDRTRLVRANITACNRRLRHLQSEWNAGRITFDSVQQAVNAWIGHASHGDTWTIRRRLLDRYPFSLSPAASPGGHTGE